MRVVIVLPALNEEKVIAATVRAVRRFADAELGSHAVTVCVVDNGSHDATEVICRNLSDELNDVRYLRLSQRGKGLAIREGWSAFDADVYVFMDSDLAVDLSALPGLVRAVEEGAGAAIGSRYHGESVVQRSAFRRLLSRGYRTLVSSVLETDISDMPCGFKAVSAEVVRAIVPSVKDNRWFFDTELVLRAERAGHRIVEIPVVWRELKPEGRESKVRVLPLMREYLTKVVLLRAELGPSRTSAPETTVRTLVGSVTSRERALVLAVSVVIALLGLLAPLLSFRHASAAGLEWTGRQIFAPGDFAVYLSYISQVKSGAWTLSNMATNERLIPVFNVLWLAVGLLARLLHVTPLVAYHVARTLLILPCLAAVYLLISHVFSALRERVSAFLLLAFGSGIGLYVVPFLDVARLSPEQWPTDFWVAESNLFMTLTYSPHFIASLGLFAAIVLLLMLALEKQRVSYGAWAGLLGLVLFNFHPFHAPTLYAVATSCLLIVTVRSGFRLRRWVAVGLFGLVSLPSVLYHYWLTHWTLNAGSMLANNITKTPSFSFVAVGMGLILPLALLGWWREMRGKTHVMTARSRDFLAVWAVVQLCLIYAPLLFQRRLIEGWQLPLAMLSVPVLASLLDMQHFKKPVARSALALAAVALLLPSTFSTVARGIEAANPLGPKAYYFFFSPQKSEALRWIRDNTPADAVVLSGWRDSNDVMGWGNRTSYAGHWSNTIDFARKQAEATQFIRAMRPEERRAFAFLHGISYVLIGRSASDSTIQGCDGAALRTVFQNDDYEICTIGGKMASVTSI